MTSRIGDVSHVRVRVTRDSVAAGDDLDAHSDTLALAAVEDAEALARALLAAYPLPHIVGGAATWCLSSGVPLAVLAQQWPEPRMIPAAPRSLTALDRDGDLLLVHFSYLAQRDPSVVWDVLGRVRLRSPR